MHSVVTFLVTVNSQPHAGSRQGCMQHYLLSRRTAQGCRPYRDNVRSLCNNLIINMVHWFKPHPCRSSSVNGLRLNNVRASSALYSACTIGPLLERGGEACGWHCELCIMHYALVQTPAQVSTHHPSQPIASPKGWQSTGRGVAIAKPRCQEKQTIKPEGLADTQASFPCA